MQGEIQITVEIAHIYYTEALNQVQEIHFMARINQKWVQADS